jgi:hypothetical protein
MKILNVLMIVSALVLGIFLAKFQKDDNDSESYTIQAEKISSVTKNNSKQEQPVLKSREIDDKPLLSDNSIVRTDNVRLKSSLNSNLVVKRIDPELERKVIEAGGNPDHLIKPRSQGELDL